MEITIAKNAGTCFGVDNAIKIAFETLERKNEKDIYILGELVHNPAIVEKLSKHGLTSLTDYHDLKEGDCLIIRAHGEKKEVYDYCNKNDIDIIDCTCPFVKKAQAIAEKLEKEGYNVVIVGDAEHPEVRGILAQTKKGIAIKSPDEVKEKMKPYGKIGILSQTTQRIENFKAIVAEIIGYGKKIKVFNTICSATEKRQNAAKDLCKKVDLMIIIGGKNSSNTKKLYELCKENVNSYWIQDHSELKEEWLKNIDNVGITAGASTPDFVIDEVIEKIKGISG